VILTDAGPLVAIVDRGQQDHNRCVAALAELDRPMLTTWPAFTEAMYLLGIAAGWQAQNALWSMLLQRDLEVLQLEERLLQRAHDLMERYRDVPMDLADATLVAVAEGRRLSAIFTIDSDFLIYRLHGRTPFLIVPGPGSA
jgi:predicted nucleic acid-binding protein